MLECVSPGKRVRGQAPGLRSRRIGRAVAVFTHACKPSEFAAVWSVRGWRPNTVAAHTVAVRAGAAWPVRAAVDVGVVTQWERERAVVQILVCCLRGTGTITCAHTHMQ
eukprot:6194569-Pleurochrysis_carterae.AAC.4